MLDRVAQGASNKEIAAHLSIAENTVKNHLKNILEKLHLENRVQAATFAIRAGLTGPALAAALSRSRASPTPSERAIPHGPLFRTNPLVQRMVVAPGGERSVRASGVVRSRRVD